MVMYMKTTFILLGVALIVLAACSQGKTTTPIPLGTNPPSVTGVTPPSENTSGTPPTPPRAPSKVFLMEAKQFAFVPNQIVVTEGDNVVIKIKSTDVQHGFALPDFGIDKALPPGQDVLVSFSTDKPGTFEFFCNIPCGPGHQEMKGTIIVNPK
jgi:cytochrome c oxidase subunit 2